jgi:hypothetical protein
MSLSAGDSSATTASAETDAEAAVRRVTYHIRQLAQAWR